MKQQSGLGTLSIHPDLSECKARFISVCIEFNWPIGADISVDGTDLTSSPISALISGWAFSIAILRAACGSGASLMIKDVGTFKRWSTLVATFVIHHDQGRPGER